jgi:hypothetical protein
MPGRKDAIGCMDLNWGSDRKDAPPDRTGMMKERKMGDWRFPSSLAQSLLLQHNTQKYHIDHPIDIRTN